MKKLGFALVVLSLGVLTRTASAQHTDTQGGTCYECVQGPGYMNCEYPDYPGHISCIPYTVTCSVGAACRHAFQTLQVTPDGSFRSPANLLAQALASFNPEIGRNCLGLITFRSYAGRKLEQIRTETSQIRI